LIRPWRAAAVALAIVASLWAGFTIGRVSAPAVHDAPAVVGQGQGFGDIPTAIPTGESGRVWGHWDSAPVRTQPQRGSDASPHARAHHRVKWS
jgi:hypothetical protein